MILCSRPAVERLSDTQWLSRFAASEWSMASLLELGARSRRALAARLRRTGHRIVVSLLLPETESGTERITIAGEILEELGGMALLARISKRVRDLDDGGGTLLLRARRELPSQFGLWVDPGEVFYRLDLPAVDWVADPLWHPEPAWRSSPILKLHGWHEARWIRYYGEAQLKLAHRRSKRAQVLMFGHSKREEEAARFIQSFERGSS